jgi:hypothetical protein
MEMAVFAFGMQRLTGKAGLGGSRMAGGQAQSRWIEEGLNSYACFLGKIDPSRF